MCLCKIRRLCLFLVGVLINKNVSYVISALLNITINILHLFIIHAPTFIIQHFKKSEIKNYVHLRTGHVNFQI